MDQWSYSGWSNLAILTYLRTYARHDNGPTENFPQTVERVLKGNIKNHNLSEKEINTLEHLLLSRKAGPAGRGWWFSGAPAHEKLGAAALQNPLHEDTKILTKEYGWISLKEIEGLKVTVLSNTKLYGRDNSNAANPTWAPATISHKELHPCMEITFEDKKGIETKVISSLNHRWFIKENTKTNWKRVTTEELEVGFFMPKTTPCKNYNLSIEGAKHGFFFGDGARKTGILPQFGIENVTVLRNLFKEDRFLKNNDIEAIVNDCPFAWGELPEGPFLKDHKYIYGFLAGYFAADGHLRKTNAEMRIHSARREELEAVKNLCRIIGISTGEIYLDSTSSNFKEERELYCLSLSCADVTEDFFLKSRHKEIWNEFGKQKRNHLKITNLKKLDGLYPVLCATVPELEQFVIDGFCLTSNCWFVTADDWENFVLAMDLLMLGGGVGISVEHRFVSKLPKIKKDITILHSKTKDAKFIVPDSREGWCELIRKTLEAYFITGKSFDYSTVCVRGYGEEIRGFGGTSSGPAPLVECIKKICILLDQRAGTHVRPIDAADILCCIGEMVVAGNVRRSAILVQGDAWDKTYLKCKRWDLGQVPTQRAMANFSVVCDDVDDLHPLFWETYKHGEPFGIINRKNIQKYGRMGELKKDFAQGVNPCGESVLVSGEPCSLQELFLPNLTDEKELIEAARLMHRWGKRITLEHYHNEQNDTAVKKYRRIGTGITGCLQSPLFKPEILDRAYAAIQEENISYSKELGIPESIRTTVVKPSGTMSIMGDVTPGIHPSYSRFYIRRVRFSANDPLIPIIRAAGHPVEPVVKFDGSFDSNTLVAEFYCQTAPGTPIADEDWDTWKQLDVLKMAQKHWADQAVSVTVYYKKEDISQLKDWLRDNLSQIKTVSFLCHNDHGFKQAPYEALSELSFNKATKKIKPLELGIIEGGYEISSQECSSGSCPIK